MRNTTIDFDTLLSNFKKEISSFPVYEKHLRPKTTEEMKEYVSKLQKFESQLSENPERRIELRSNPKITSEQRTDELLANEKRLNNYNKNELERVRQSIIELYKELRRRSKAQSIYWDFCSSDTYMNTYQNRLESFIVENKNCTNKKFELSEKENLILKISDSEVNEDNRIIPKSFNYMRVELNTIFDKIILNQIKINETEKLTYISTNDNNLLIKESNNPYPNVFKDTESYNLFLKIINKLNVLDANNKAKKRGFQPVASSIFTKGKEQLFVYKVALRDYINFLNDKFNAELTDTTRLSDGCSHHKRVKIELNINRTNKSE